MDVITQLNLDDENGMIRLAEGLATIAQHGDVLALEGDLGTGKSVFARAFISTRNGAPLEVPSPTFTLVQSYEIDSGTIHHFDLYRLETPDDVLELGLEDAFATGVSLIEWPDRAEGILPPNHLEIFIKYGASNNQRTVNINGDAVWKQRWENAKLV
jgi:tRNA threonylcarbamoyl adenosine modification protein YjeE